MKTADLYVRVSTDEQAEKGYSLRSQQEELAEIEEVKKPRGRKRPARKTTKGTAGKMSQVQRQTISL